MQKKIHSLRHGQSVRRERGEHVGANSVKLSLSLSTDGRDAAAYRRHPAAPHLLRRPASIASPPPPPPPSHPALLLIRNDPPGIAPERLGGIARNSPRILAALPRNPVAAASVVLRGGSSVDRFPVSVGRGGGISGLGRIGVGIGLELFRSSESVALPRVAVGESPWLYGLGMASGAAFRFLDPICGC
ncbi:hypothetical protein NL676_037623 [Syzygium grande]|nr:hypothetical protein NL676_037623 [Syzygium grande]